MRALVITLVLFALGGVAAWQLGIIQLGFTNLPSFSRQAQERSQQDIFNVAKTGDPEKLQAALAAGGNLAARDAYGQTPLMYAAAKNSDPRVIEAMLRAGADINAVTDSGWTALMYAARDNTNPEVALLLLQAGANPTLVNSEGQRAIDLAADNGAVRRSSAYRIMEALQGRPFDPAWPSGYTVPVQGAHFSGRPSHLPNSPRAYRNGIHEGFDFYNGVSGVPIEYGTPVVATAPGVIIRADHAYQEMTLAEYEAIVAEARQSAITPERVLDKLRGRQVEIEHPGGFVSRYAHLSGIPEEIQVGVRVRQGQIVGYSGNSGTIEAARGTQDDPHPHYELWRGRTYLGEGMTPDEIYTRVAQIFGPQALPPFRE
jgi:murein DD-endopeptidase MepM/ murein hydrolase activator NlpD